MLEFFRRYQQFFFIIITVVIVISFSFFGTNPNGSPTRPTSEIKAFTAKDGSFVSKADLDEMVLFISTDALDKQLFGGQWGLNFLNDGVVRQDILSSGLIHPILEKYWSDLQPDFSSRRQKELKYQPYVHPAAGQAISAETVWRNFAPDLADAYNDYKSEGANISLDGAIKKTKLYVEESKFPQIMLKRVLTFQQQQAPWAGSDPAISREDLSLYGYHTLDDWFGSKFTQLIAEVIWNGSIHAQKLGYKVSDEEATNELLANAEKTFTQMQGLDGFYFDSPNDLFHEQLRRMQMDAPRAVALWKKVLLFRKMITDASSAVLIDPFMYKQFAAYAGESVEVQLYKAPNALRINSFADLQHLDIYLDSVAKGKYAGLNLPKEFLSLSEVEKNAPELVQKNYTITLQSVNKDQLALQVTLRQMWEWQSSDAGWKLLKDKFPPVKDLVAVTPDERSIKLDQLEPKLRKDIDAYSRDTMVTQDPALIDKALADQEPKEVSLGFRLKGGNFQIAGITDRAAFEKVLDQAPINEKSTTLTHYSQDQKNFHTITVKIRDDAKRILTFEESRKDGTLEMMARDKLEAHYAQIRANNKELYQEKGEWKPLAMVRDKVAEDYFAKTLDLIQQKVPEVKGQSPFVIATYRLHPHVDEEKQTIMRNPTDYGQEKSPLLAQWQLEKVNEVMVRSKLSPEEIDQALTLEPGVWSSTKYDLKQGSYFYQTIKHIPYSNGVLEQIQVGQSQLAQEVQKEIMTQIL